MEGRGNCDTQQILNVIKKFKTYSKYNQPSAGNKSELRQLIANGVNISETTLDETIIIAVCDAAILGDQELLDIFHQLRVDLNCSHMKYERKTPLILASEFDKLECVCFLLEKNALPNLVDQNENTAVMLASKKGCTRCVKKLISWAAILDWENSSGRTAVQMADGHNDIVRLLNEALSVGPGHYAALHQAIKHNRTAAISRLALKSSLPKFESQEDHFYQDGTYHKFPGNEVDRSLLMLAIFKDNPDILEALINKNPDIVTCHPCCQFSLLMLTGQEGRIKCLQIFTKHDADVTGTDVKGNNVLMITILSQQRISRIRGNEILQATIAYLIREGGKIDENYVNCKNGQGETALTLACNPPVSLDTIKKLVEAGADVNHRNGQDKTPETLALGYENSRDVVTYLRIA